MTQEVIMTTSGKRRVPQNALFPRKPNRSMFGDRHISDVHDYGFDRWNRIIYLGKHASTPHDESSVDERMADAFEKNLDLLHGLDPHEPILIKISSEGGGYIPGEQIIGAVNECPNPITMIGVRSTCSMAAYIALAADRFYLRPPAKYMIHHGYTSFDGSIHLAHTEHKELLKAQEMHMQLVVTRLKERGRFSSLSEDEIRDMLVTKYEKCHDVWLDADETVEWGIADPYTYPCTRATKRNDARRELIREVLRKEYVPTTTIRANNR